MTTEVYTYMIDGTSSLLLHSPKALIQERSGGGVAGTLPEKMSTAEEAEKGAYRDEYGFLYLPSAAFKASMMHGARGRRIGETAARTVLAGSVFAVKPRTNLIDAVSYYWTKKYEIHLSRVVVEGNSVIRARPEIKWWSCVLELEVDLDFTNPWQVEELLKISGRTSGVGDFRPECGGPHGRYRARFLEQRLDPSSVFPKSLGGSGEDP